MKISVVGQHKRQRNDEQLIDMYLTLLNLINIDKSSI